MKRAQSREGTRSSSDAEVASAQTSFEGSMMRAGVPVDRDGPDDGPVRRLVNARTSTPTGPPTRRRREGYRSLGGRALHPAANGIVQAGRGPGHQPVTCGIGGDEKAGLHGRDVAPGYRSDAHHPAFRSHAGIGRAAGVERQIPGQGFGLNYIYKPYRSATRGWRCSGAHAHAIDPRREAAPTSDATGPSSSPGTRSSPPVLPA